MEGIIVKNVNSHYILNDRSNKWLKLKPDYIEGLGDTLDLIILGTHIKYYYSSSYISIVL